ncbi:MAG: hypothetical protein ACK4QW_19680, partial [Alphaproteobacteria bacterium]
SRASALRSGGTPAPQPRTPTPSTARIDDAHFGSDLPYTDMMLNHSVAQRWAITLQRRLLAALRETREQRSTEQEELMAAYRARIEANRAHRTAVRQQERDARAAARAAEWRQRDAELARHAERAAEQAQGSLAKLVAAAGQTAAAVAVERAARCRCREVDREAEEREAQEEAV